jgi:hypothetical protein
MKSISLQAGGPPEQVFGAASLKCDGRRRACLVHQTRFAKSSLNSGIPNSCVVTNTFFCFSFEVVFLSREESYYG